MIALLRSLKLWVKSPWILFIGLKYLRSKRNSKFLSLITWLSLGGVAIGVAALIVVLSVMDGFENELHKKLRSTDLHILAVPKESGALFERNQFHLEEKITDDLEVASIVPVVETEVILKTGSRVSGVMIKGVPKERFEGLRKKALEIADPRLLVKEGKQGEPVELPGLLLGRELAYNMSLLPGDILTVISPLETEGPLSSVPRLKRFVLEGIYSAGLPEQELHTVFGKETDVFSFLKKNAVVSHWEISVKTFKKAPEVAQRLAARFPEIEFKDWQQLNASLVGSLKLEQFAMFLILIFVVIVASFNIVTTLTQMVLEKKKEIAVFKSIGATDQELASVFVFQGLWIGGIGIAAGASLGFVVCFILHRYPVIQLPDVFYDRTLPVTFDPLHYIAVIGSTILILLVATYYPSRRAAKVRPVDALR